MAFLGNLIDNKELTGEKHCKWLGIHSTDCSQENKEVC